MTTKPDSNIIDVAIIVLSKKVGASVKVVYEHKGIVTYSMVIQITSSKWRLSTVIMIKSPSQVVKNEPTAQIEAAEVFNDLTK